MIFHQFINDEMCRAYVRVYAICQYLHIWKALDKLVSNLHPQSSTSSRHLIHIVMICNDPSCSRDIIPTYDRSNYATNSSPKSSSKSLGCSPRGVSQRKVEVKETNPCNPGALPNQQVFTCPELTPHMGRFLFRDWVRVEFPTLAASRAKDTRNDEREFFKMKDNNSGETPQVAIRFLPFRYFVDIDFCWKDIYPNWGSPEVIPSVSRLQAQLQASKQVSEAGPSGKTWADPIIQHTNPWLEKRRILDNND